MNSSRSLYRVIAGIRHRLAHENFGVINLDLSGNAARLPLRNTGSTFGLLVTEKGSNDSRTAQLFDQGGVLFDLLGGGFHSG